MVERYIGLLFAMYVGFLFVFGLVATSAFLINMSHINDYKADINAAIEQEGGLTPQAMTLLNEESADRYHSVFHVTSTAGNAPVPYGQTVTYTITGSMPFPLFHLPAFSVTSTGSAVSLVRGS